MKKQVKLVLLLGTSFLFFDIIKLMGDKYFFV